MNIPELVFLDSYGIKGINFYWDRRKQYGFSEEDLIAVGISNNRVRTHPSIVEPLYNVNQYLQENGLCLFVKEGYRPPALYDLAYERKVAMSGVDVANRLFDMNRRPHATGLSVDVVLWDISLDKEVFLRDGNDGIDAMFVDYYKDARDEKSQRFHNLQATLITAMQEKGFRLGQKLEYWHFDYRPGIEPNYPVRQ